MKPVYLVGGGLAGNLEMVVGVNVATSPLDGGRASLPIVGKKGYPLMGMIWFDAGVCTRYQGVGGV